MKNRLVIALILLLLLSTYSIQTSYNFFSIFNIKKILIYNNQILDKKEIQDNLSYLYDKNLFFLPSKKIKKDLNKYSLIDSFEIKKKYPNKIQIKIYEKKPILIIQNKKKRYFYTDKSDLIEFSQKINTKDMPIVFGDEKNFDKIFKNLKKIKFPIHKVKTFYFFDSYRWDLITKKNKIIKLPSENYEKSLMNFLDLENDKDFKNFNTFDYRINGQLILK